MNNPDQPEPRRNNGIQTSPSTFHQEIPSGSMKSLPIGVVGGGLGGLAAACTLAARGHAVVLFEKSSWLGGKAAVLEEEGYRFDMGPTILTVPSVLRRIFHEAGQPVEEALQLVQLEPQWRSFFTDGSTLDLVSDVNQMSQNLESFAPGTSRGYREFLDFSENLHRISREFFFYRSLGSIWDMMDLRNMFKPGMLRDVLRMRLGQTVAESIRSHVPERRVAQMLDHFTQYVGSAPDASPAVLCGIAHMQTQEGVWYPMGGTGAVPRALAKLACDLGVEVRTETGIRRIITDSTQRVRGVETESGEQVPLLAVVSNADAVRTHRELLTGQPVRRFERRRKYEPACSGVVLYLGLDRAYDHLEHHNFIFSADPHLEFEYIYRKGEPAPDPTCYVCAPSRTEPGVAPEGGEALYVLVHTPYLRSHHDWERMLPQYRRVILEKMKRTGNLPDLEQRIRVERFLTPRDIHERYRVLNGAIYGLASHGRFNGAFKPANRSRDVLGLYLAGGAAHPGPGMPMVLMSGWIAADALDTDIRGSQGDGQQAWNGKRPSTARSAPGSKEGIQQAESTEEPTPTTTHSAPQSALASSSSLPRGPLGQVQEKTPPDLDVANRRSPWMIRLFTRYIRRYLGRNFHAVRLAQAGRADVLQAANTNSDPVVVILNHPSWWDPLMGLVLSELFPEREHFGPIDASALGKYGFFKRLGFYGVEQGTPSGALSFLRTTTGLLQRPGATVWITAQGQFTDPRQRPVRLNAGVGYLLRRLKKGYVLPLALEYPFWTERYPEALARFGTPLSIAESTDRSVEEWMRVLESELEATQDALAQDALRRDPQAFITLIGGKAGVGGVFDFWRRMKSWFQGERFVPEHMTNSQNNATQHPGEVEPVEWSQAPARPEQVTSQR